MATYQVVGDICTVTFSTLMGRSRQTLYKGAILPEDVPQREIDHLLSVRLITQIDTDEGEQIPPADPNVTGDGKTVPTVSTPQVGETPDASPPVAQEPDPEVEAARAAARAQLPEDGSLPPDSATKPVWVEAAVARGLDRQEAEKATKPDLIQALKAPR